MKTVLTLITLFFVQNLLAQPFNGLSDAIESGNYGNLKAVVISRHGEVIYEDYFRNTRPDDLHQVFSVTKSVGSALIGIAHRQGVIRLDQDLGVFFNQLYPLSQPPFQDQRFITVEAILQQRHGIQWDEWTIPYDSPDNPLHQAEISGDWYRYVLTRPMDAQPGQKFTYNTMASNLMSRMIRFSTGLSPREFATQELFGPLGIQNTHWELFSNQGMGHGQTVWPNPDADEPLGYGLWLRPLDMVTFGELYLNGGIHDGRRILDKEWIDASWEIYSQFDNPGHGYGYQWWINTTTDNRERTWKRYYAAGWARQYILVFPELGMVVASVADDFDYDGPGINALLRDYVLPELNPRLDQRFTGAWYDPENDGQGLTLEIIEDGNRLIAFWYTYGENQSKRWFTLDGPIDGHEADVSIIQTSGGSFLQPDPVERSEWGTGHFSAIDCSHINLEINSEEIITTVMLSRLTGSCDYRD
jgi:CubicO group peptidase (beta-lactamase class C family)